MRVFIRYPDNTFFAGFKSYYVEGKECKTISFGSFYEAKTMEIEEAKILFKRSLVKVEFLINQSSVGLPKFKEIIQ